MYNEHFKIYFIARFFWKIIKIIIIEHYMSILGVIYKNWGFCLEGCLTLVRISGGYSQEMIGLNLSGQPIIKKS